MKPIGQAHPQAKAPRIILVMPIKIITKYNGDCFINAALCTVPTGQIPKDKGQLSQATLLLQIKAVSLNINKDNCVYPRAGITHLILMTFTKPTIMIMKKVIMRKSNKLFIWSFGTTLFGEIAAFTIGLKELNHIRIK